jgi:hypothetical protein
MFRPFLLTMTAVALAAGAAPAHGQKARAGKAEPAMPAISDNEVLTYVCNLIGNRTPEAARNQRKCRESASLGQGRQRGVRPRRQVP